MKNYRNQPLRTFALLSAVAVVYSAMCPLATAADWGSLKGRFVLDGDAPAVKALNVNKDVEFCSQHDPKDETLQIAEDGSIQGVILFLRVGRGKSVEVHPDYEASLSDPVVLDNKGCVFQSHVTLVRTGQPFTIKNSDTVGHNTNAALSANGQFNIIIPAGGQRDMTFSKAERLPLPINCNIHPWMTAHLLVLDHPYMASSGADGSFEIKNIPAGKQEFQFWQERIGYLKNCKYDGGSLDGSLDRRGRGKVTIAAGETLDLGDIKVPVSLIK